MILVRVELENYKQYAGSHTVEFPEGGVVAVIGANGVGKTTLFEAIEWCLYNPREIANEEVPPHNGTGATRVALTLADPETGERWVVERRLKKRGTDAEVYKEDEPGSPVVQGTRQVTDYVERRLIGLPHKAFVSTFFTRQKELSFFGTDKPTERRREIARLLGHDTIRTAQELIGEERKLTAASLAALQAQIARASADRDFPREIAVADEQLAAATAAVTTAEDNQEAASAALVKAVAALEAIRELERRHAAARQVAVRLNGEANVARANLGAAEQALRQLDDAERDRIGLAAVAAEAPERERAVADHDAERERARVAAEARERRRKAERALADVGHRVADAVNAVPGSGAVEGWVWTDADATDPRRGAVRLLGVIAELGIEEADVRLADLTRCEVAVLARTEARRKSLTYREARRKLDEERNGMLAGGDPRLAQKRAGADRDAAMEAVAEAVAFGQSARAEAERASRIVGNLQGQRLDEPCPTCNRPFDPAEVKTTLDAFTALRDARLAEAERAGEAERAARAVVAEAQAREAAAGKQLEALANVEGRIERSQSYLTDAEADVEARNRAAADALRECGLSAEPTAAEVAEAKHYSDLLHAVERTRIQLAAQGERAGEIGQVLAETEAVLAELGGVAYDPAAHEEARQALARAREAAGAVAEIDRRLATRPTHEAQRAEAAATVARTSGELVDAEAAARTIGFDPAALLAARGAEAAAGDQNQEAQQRLHAARTERSQAAALRDRLLAEKAALDDLTERAEARYGEAADLDRMQKEFGRFDQYVANLVGPILADRTGEFLAEVTDGKYNRVAFDQDYGLRIYDEDDAFPIERFSGGERDVAALCARLALSTMIGAQATHPPRFAVLDEVFGSLDEDRRTQVLGTLGKLAETSEALRQLFIISHVEDVHSSPVVSEVWRVSEVGGVSRVQQDDRRERLLEQAVAVGDAG
jgi:exonuclease SbcC